MRRREFIPLLGAAMAWPMAAHTQQAAMPVIGFLRSASFDDMTVGIVSAFRQGLREAGYVEGQNVVIAFRSAEGRNDRLPEVVAELIRLPVHVIVANGPAALAAKAATTTVPIVFVGGGDPVRDGFVASLSRPGNNVTGVTFLNSLLITKQLELLHELVPTATNVGLLVDATNPSAMSAETDAQAVASALGIRIVVAHAGSERDIDAAIARVVQQQVGAILILGAAFFLSRINQIVALTARHALPAISANREYVTAGGLMSYSGSLEDAYHQAGAYAGRILGGARAADLPVVQGTHVELAINLRTARALGLAIPPTLLARADEVIE
jgi:putative ABC transport system substrate-binding protein